MAGLGRSLYRVAGCSGTKRRVLPRSQSRMRAALRCMFFRLEETSLIASCGWLTYPSPEPVRGICAAMSGCLGPSQYTPCRRKNRPKLRNCRDCRRPAGPVRQIGRADINPPHQLRRRLRHPDSEVHSWCIRYVRENPRTMHVRPYRHNSRKAVRHT
jgi:hypothetical protein